MDRNIGDIKWLAGLLEGEGYFGFDESPALRLYMTDLDIVERARVISGTNNKLGVRPPTGASRKTQYGFRINGNHAVAWMMTLYSIMGIRRRERIREVIQRWKEMFGHYQKGIHTEKNIRRRAIRAIMISRKISREEAIKILDEVIADTVN